MFNMGVYSPNEIRKALDLTAIEGGDQHVAQVNLTTLENIAKLAEAPVDNKLKGNAESEEPVKEEEVSDDKETE
jgi:tRNA threonylcarbamoyladenosine modification (KEOPS) complex Cgi121 subunit